MAKKMLIDATYPEETRVVVVSGNRLEDFDYETASKRQLKGNIYLAKVTRVEPSLQAAFVDYGGNRHGFLAFNEIHPDYYRIPISDREKLIAEEAESEEHEDGENGESVEVVGGDEFDDMERRRRRLARSYKIQEVIKRRQIMLVQVVKEERGNKGAALTTYLSLPGRYCVLMPNTGRGGGISRKITNARDRKRLKSIVEDLNIPEGMAVILRTAGSERSKAEIKRDYEYLVRLWDDIRNQTLQSTAPSLIYEEANLIKRALRDLYSKDICEILVEGDEGYRSAKDFMKSLIPSHAKRVQPYKSDGVPLFQRYQIESQLDSIHSPIVQLRSGGYIVIHQTEALVAIDVNSGRSTRERHIEETALKTNLEAADEVARQVRLRDLAGLIVIDFIDMEEARNNHAVERRFKEALRNDRARIQLGRISHFGLLEMSRQRMRPSLMEISSEICKHCGGTGHVRSTEWVALSVLRTIEEEGLRGRAREITVTVPTQVALYILNQKRKTLAEIEARYDFRVLINTDDEQVAPDIRVDVAREPTREATGAEKQAAVVEDVADSDERQDGDRDEEAEAGEQGRRKRRRRRRNRRSEEPATAAATEDIDQATAEEGDAAEATGQTEEAAGPDEGQPRRRRRGRRGGRRRGRKGHQSTEADTQESALQAAESESSSSEAGPSVETSGPEIPATNAEEFAEAGNADALDTIAGASPATDAETEAAKPAPRRRSPRRKATEVEATDAVETREEQGESVAPGRPSEAPETVSSWREALRSNGADLPAATEAEEKHDTADASNEAEQAAGSESAQSEITRDEQTEEDRGTAEDASRDKQGGTAEQTGSGRRGWWQRVVN